MDEEKFFKLYEYAISVECAVDMKRSEVMKIMDINSNDYNDNFVMINTILEKADEEKS